MAAAVALPTQENLNGEVEIFVFIDLVKYSSKKHYFLLFTVLNFPF